MPLNKETKLSRTLVDVVVMVGSYSSAEMQSVYSTAPVYWVIYLSSIPI